VEADQFSKSATLAVNPQYCFYNHLLQKSRNTVIRQHSDNRFLVIIKLNDGGKSYRIFRVTTMSGSCF
jgi:hypothetical protein